MAGLWIAFGTLIIPILFIVKLESEGTPQWVLNTGIIKLVLFVSFLG